MANLWNLGLQSNEIGDAGMSALAGAIASGSLGSLRRLDQKSLAARDLANVAKAHSQRGSDSVCFVGSVSFILPEQPAFASRKASAHG